MTRQTSAVDVTNFVAGLITEASPLSFPANASLSEKNFSLNKEGTRQRRLGMDLEDSYQEIITDVVVPASGEVPFKVFRWTNVGGDASRDLVVVQVGNEVSIFDASAQPLSSSQLYTTTIADAVDGAIFSFAVVDGTLIIASGSQTITSLKFTNNSISSSTYRLLVRDFFGVSDIVNGVNLRVGSGITTRPTTSTDEHIYNLRNQTWAEPRMGVGSDGLRDQIFQMGGGAYYPSNADVITYSLYPDTASTSDPLSDRVNILDIRKNPIGTTAAPKGYFIIDALARGASRLSEAAELSAKYPALVYQVGNLPQDVTPIGATVVAQFAGRVFYAGFSGEVINGDDNSPRMSSYVLFSKLVDDTTDLGVCYQGGDPTSKEEPDLLDTDGGYLRIDGAYGITSMFSVNNSLLVVAANGIWTVQGGSDYGFKATNYVVSKVTSFGCASPSSAVLVDTSLMYWSEDGIYVVSQNQYGDYVAEGITHKTIKSMFLNIESLDRASCSGSYDVFEKKVYWTYGNRINSTDGSSQLIFDVTLGSFYKYEIGSNKYPMIVAGGTLPPFRLGELSEDVEVDGVQVTVDTNAVEVTSSVKQSTLSETVFLSIIGTSPTISFSFSSYRDRNFRDWKSIGGVGVDAKAEMLTGWTAPGDLQRYKQVPYLTMYFNKTEDGFIEDVSGDWKATNESSCIVSSQWDWTNRVNSGKWGKKYQMYRINRHYIPDNLDDEFDNGYSVVTTKNKLRGKGRVFSMLIETEPYKDCQLLGWSLVIGTNGNV